MRKKLLATTVVTLVLASSLNMVAFARDGYWQTDKRGTWYEYTNNTYPKAKWVEIDGQQYHFDSDGYLDINKWVLGNDSRWYFVNGNGVMVTGWNYINDKWYYMDASGAMYTGWMQRGDKWYYLNPDNGQMKTGWAKVGESWYYLDKEGVMQKGWITVDNSKYYLSDSGAMVTGKVKIKDAWYLFDNAGRWIDSANSEEILDASNLADPNVSIITKDMTWANIQILTDKYYDRYYNEINGYAARINELRGTKGALPLNFSSQLSKASIAHCINMISYGYYGHDNPGSTDIKEWEYIPQLYDSYVDSETINRAQSPDIAINQLANNEDDFNNICDKDYETFGIGVAKNEETGLWYLVIMFEK